MKKQQIKNLVPYIFLAAFGLVLFTKPFGSGDELWNYSFAKNIAAGMVPYRDFSIVQTPLSAYIPGLLMAIFGDGLIVHRAFGALTFYLLGVLCYRVCKKATGSYFISVVAALFLCSICLPYYIYNYNYLSALVVLIIFSIEQKNKKESTLRSVVLGLLVGILPLIKQNTGAMFLLANGIVCAISTFRYKYSLKQSMIRVVSSVIPGLIFLLYLLMAGAMDDFLEYAVFGVATFVHRTTVLDLLYEVPFYIIYIIFIVYAFVAMAVSMIKNGTTHMQRVGFWFAAAWMMVMFPLFDSFHLVCVFWVLVPALCMFAPKKDYRLWEKSASLAVTGFIASISVMAFLPIGQNNVLSQLNNFELIPIDARAEMNIGIVSQYITQKQAQGYQVRITDDTASAYKIPLDQYEKNWDMMLVGNIGANTIETLMESDKPCLYLVYQFPEKLGSQDHFELIQYVKDNCVKIDEVVRFDVYQPRQ